MNTNIDNISKDLKKELSEDEYRKLNLTIYDRHKNNYSSDDGFQEKMFKNLFIDYVTNEVEISKNKYSIFDIHTGVLIEQEDLAVIGKVISIVVKHLSKIEFI